LSRRRGLIFGLLGVLVVFVGVIIIRGALGRVTSPPPPPTLPPPLTSSVLVTTHAIPLRGILKAEDLTLVEVPIELVPPGALTGKSAAAGKITKVPLAAGEMVLEHHLADPTKTSKDLAFTIGDDQVIMAFPATDLMSQINILQAGDLVDILVSLELPVLPAQAQSAGAPGQELKSEDQLFTFNALQRITVQAVVVKVTPQRTTGTTGTTASRTSTTAGATPAPTPTPVPPEIEPQAILLALSPQDALVLKHLKDAGGVIDIVLRAPTSSQLFEPEPVMPDYLKDRYELDKRR
jgi:pilus assembly protein CpaB